MRRIDGLREVIDDYQVRPTPTCAWVATPQTSAAMQCASCTTACPLHLARHQGQGLLLDQFGVLHDGQRPYPGAMDAVRAAAAAGKRIIIISNSSRRCGGTLAKLGRMGFDEAWFAGGRPHSPA